MNTVNYLGNTVKYYDSTEDLIVERHLVYQKALILDNALGSELNKIPGKITLIKGLVARGKADDANKELDNILTLYGVVNKGINLKLLATSACVFEINGKPVQISSTDDAMEVHKQLQTVLPVKMVIQMLDGIKKKLIQRLKGYFQKKKARLRISNT